MHPVNKIDIDNLIQDYHSFLKLGNSELKSAYLAASGRGFTEIIESGKDNVLLVRISDNKFVIVSYPMHQNEKIEIEKNIRIVRFHADKNLM